MLRVDPQLPQQPHSLLLKVLVLALHLQHDCFGALHCRFDAVADVRFRENLLQLHVLWVPGFHLEAVGDFVQHLEAVHLFAQHARVLFNVFVAALDVVLQVVDVLLLVDRKKDKRANKQTDKRTRAR